MAGRVKRVSYALARTSSQFLPFSTTAAIAPISTIRRVASTNQDRGCSDVAVYPSSMAMDHDATTPTSRKRQLPQADAAPASTPASSKRIKLDGASPQSPSTPRALNAIASAISGVFGYARQQQKPADSGTASESTSQPHAANGNVLAANPSSQAPAVPHIRPAIKLAALRGTKWDKGDIVGPKLARKSAATSTRATPSKARGRPKNGSAASASNRRPNGAPPNGLATDDGSGPADELAPIDFIADTPTKNRSVPPKSRTGMTPKGILTPTKKRGRPPKSVTFNKGLSGEVFFEDLPKTPSAKKSRASRKKEAEAEENDDEIRCAICSKPDSKAPNEIILCDNCDFAAHQLCYEVSEIPEGDWLCKSCAQEDVLQTPSRPADAGRINALAAPAPAEIPDIPNLEQHLRSFQRVLLDRCCGRRRIRMFGHDESYDKARQLVEQTVVAGEGNSMLMIGPRGCGKTTMVENIILDLSQEHRHLFHVVRLSGFIHTDDKLALKEIWRQLGKEMEVEDELVSRTNYADTMASLLALLSHPSEITGADEGVTSQSVVFIIDEFDMFASHPRQTLLYNLFDIAQSRKAPIAVLGCTTRLDVVEMLEKRVKSRFSHRYVYLSPPRSLPAFWQVCRHGLMIDRTDVDKEGIDAGLEGYEEFHKYWTRKIEELYKQRAFQNLLQYHFFTTKSASAFFTEWILPLSSVSARDATLNCPTAGAELTSLAPPDSRLQLLPTLSELDLGMLIAAARLDIVAHTDTVNFAMAYDEYSGLVGRQRVQSATSGMLAVGGSARIWSRGVAGIAWERLISLGMLVSAGIGGSRAPGHGGLDGKMWKVDVALEEIPSAVKLGAVQAKWCREI
ncbi:AAA ATPase domain-containing protein [Hirsutella rhossiliensis]|uniref:Origin recognition complex subunit 4 n=1 Tax=Hirsutella rhossiliensis TaxID=111463 RepID=A0A9P8N1T5_9HYPO|nr:AAA ATPase domain-containing protein [Hirsutella rhossiliensis]KAH0966653.1 AAA ATPase domain-containing protein [Hirsutella rhossiliensis]